MYYLVYETTNLTNGRIYVGSHKTTVVEDGYLGSGTLMRRAIRKHGPDNFSRRIIKECSSAEEMYSLEAQIVDADFVARKDTYNVKLGGQGGFDHLNVEGIKYKFTAENQKLGSSATRTRAQERFESKNYRCLNCETPLRYQGKSTTKQIYCSRSCSTIDHNRKKVIGRGKNNAGLV